MAVCSLSKLEIQQKIDLKEYKLKKMNINRLDVEKKRVSAIWMFMSEIYPVRADLEIPSKMEPLKGFLCAPDGTVLIKKDSTTNISNYLGKCKSVKKEDREKFFSKGMRRYSALKKRRREPNQAGLERYGIQLMDDT